MLWLLRLLVSALFAPHRSRSRPDASISFYEAREGYGEGDEAETTTEGW